MQDLPKFPAFKPYACTGDSVHVDLGNVRITARLEPDMDTGPKDFDCYDEAQIAAWHNDEWQFVGVVLSVHVGDLELTDHAASLWGVECNFPGSDNSYLTEVAQELLPEAAQAAKGGIEALRATLAAVVLP